MISKSNQFEFRHLRYFLVLAELLHYRKASEQLSISQSALSQQIKQLEFLIGAKLFDRSNRKVQLSTAGSLFVAEAQTIVRQIETSMERWNLALKGVEGLLKIGFVGSAMQEFLPPIIKQFATTYPKIQFRLVELTNIEQLEALADGRIDIGFMRSNQATPEMYIRSVYKEKFFIGLTQKPSDYQLEL